MENNHEKDINDTSIFRGDFKDFEDNGEFNAPELDKDIIEQEVTQETPDTTEQKLDKTQEEQEIKEEQSQEENKEEVQQYIPSPWDNLEEENSAVKKYLFYISKDFVRILDNLTTDEKSAYINDAIQKKIDIENIEKQSELKKKITTHLIIMILTFIFATPFVLWISHKAIMATFDNYKYSQENFEKLYKERFSKDKAYMRSIQYNKEQKSKKH